ncbi:flagellar biosynthesis protein FlhB [Acidihalobacter aeolianus]|uniref:Flagellar biosynthetic protein FlhB n=1 Tax=Acidihalobacter aeolianus TaxID=2792603 RepID=A0A1D8K6N4_9GAMM|nr:flagellar biosynthesis protein FlhB [Acidihalobacter aeolianus]AOV16642.1 flagellar biosynthesis protein FlhB [Acidihalobacter aeolianus]
MARDDFQERTEQATPKRLQEARDRGQIPRSRELVTAAVLIAAAGGLLAFGPHLIGGLMQTMRNGLTLDRSLLMDSQALYPLLANALLHAVQLMTPLLILLVLAALLSSVALGGISFSMQAIGFKWERLDPLAGFGRVFSLNGLMELAKALVKFLVVAVVAVTVLWLEAGSLMGLGGYSVHPALALTGHLVGWSFLAFAASLILIAAADAPFQLWQHAKQLRMTQQEVRDESKETEGQPDIKRKQRQLQREIAQRRMMQEVPKADVVVTNPTHYAVALRYDQERMNAPRVVAKGKDLVAARIRETAAEHGVPVQSAPELARAIYFHTRLGQEVPTALYLVVAQLLAYVYQIKAGAAPENGPPSLSVPPEFAQPPSPVGGVD